jgi:hypothetical protein
VILCSTFEFLFEFQNRIFLEFLFDFQVVRTSNRSKFEGPLYLYLFKHCAPCSLCSPSVRHVTATRHTKTVRATVFKSQLVLVHGSCRLSLVFWGCIFTARKCWILNFSLMKF